MSKIFEFNQGQSGTLIDSVSKAAGTLTAGTGGFKKTEKGQAMLLDGAVTNIRYPTGLVNFNALTSFSLEFYIRVNPNGIYQILFDNRDGNNDGVYCQLLSGDDFSFRINNSDMNTGVSPTEGWQHYFATYDGSNMRLYIDNVLIYTLSAVGEVIDVTGAFTLGSVNYSDSTYWHGSIGKITIYDTVLTTAERNELYKDFLNSYGTTEQKRNFEYPRPTDTSGEAGLVAHYNMTPSAGGILTDISGNGNTGTLGGNPLMTKDGMKFGTSTYVTLSSAIDFGTTHTLNFRLKIDADDTLVFLGTAANGNNFVYVGGKKLSYRSNATTVAGSAEVIVEGEEQTLTISRDGTSVHFYLNGSFVETLTVSNSNPLNGINQLFARQSGLGFDGNGVDVKLYNYAFTPQQAKDYHNSFIKPVLRETFSDSPVGATHTRGWS